MCIRDSPKVLRVLVGTSGVNRLKDMYTGPLGRSIKFQRMSIGLLRLSIEILGMIMEFPRVSVVPLGVSIGPVGMPAGL